VEQVFKHAKGYVEEFVKKPLIKLNIGIRDIICEKIHSPKSYNYTSDELYFDLVVNKNFNQMINSDLLTKIELEHKELSEFLKEHYSSRPGFVSFMPNNIEDLSELLSDENGTDYDRGVAAYLNYLLRNEIKEWSDQEKFLEYISDNNGFDVMNCIKDIKNEKDEYKLKKLKGYMRGEELFPKEMSEEDLEKFYDHEKDVEKNYTVYNQKQTELNFEKINIKKFNEFK
jgi:hypothetical protein